MQYRGMKKIFNSVFFLFLLQLAQAQQPVSKDSIMITVFLKHQQDKNLDSLQRIQQKNKFTEQFPPQTARVVPGTS